MTVPIDISLIVLGYLLGSIPSAYIMGRWWGNVDMRREGDGHISATATYKYLGRKGFATVLLMDMAKGILAIYVASRFTDSNLVLVLVAYAAVIGHCWSIFLGFKGGLGGVISFAVLVSLAFRETWIAAGAALAFLLITRKSSYSTYIMMATVSIALFIERKELVLAIFPLGLMLIHYVRRFMVIRKSAGTAYTHEVFDDLKKTR